MGYIWETCFCTITQHKWANRGFLYGPIIPIYGFGGTLASVVFTQIPVASLQNPNPVTVFVICFFGSIVLEYGTSFALEKIFHAYWWDYHDKPLNINGRVCLPYSIGFGFAGMLVVYVLYPFATRFTNPLNEFWTEFMALLLMFLVGMDTAMTVSAITSFGKNLARIDDEINEQMTAFYAEFEENLEERKQTKAEEALAKKEQAEKAAAYRRQLVEEKVGKYVDTANWFAHGRFMSIEGFRRPGKDMKPLRVQANDYIRNMSIKRHDNRVARREVRRAKRLEKRNGK